MYIKKVKKSVGILLGTRPDAIKLAPLIKEFESINKFRLKIICSGQHREMFDQVSLLFKIKTHIDFDIMKKDQTLFYVTSELIKHLEMYLKDNRIDLLMVQGDTTTSMVGALSSFYYKIPIAHIEAGLRTNDKYNPYPEEINRKIIDIVSDLLFAPTENNMKNLLNEGIMKEKIYVTGNTVIDALRIILPIINPSKRLSTLIKSIDKKILTITVHRRENFGEGIKNIIKAIKILSKTNEFSIIMPLHPNPNVKNLITSHLGKIKNVYLINPLDYQSMLYLLKNSYLVLTDSGGLQEECSYLNIPVLVLRTVTERIESVNLGIAKLIGSENEKIINETLNLLKESEYLKMKKNICPYGDGFASKRIVESISKFLSQ